MAWTRTATSLISFGFTIYKFLDTEHAERPSRSFLIFRPRGVGMLMILIGLVALLLATIEHHRSMKDLRATYGNIPRSISAVVAGLIAVLGMISLIAVAFRL